MTTRTIAAILIATALSAESRSARAQAVTPPCPTSGTIMYFGNGINKTALEADAVTRDDLPGLADEAGIDGPVMFATAYNQTDGIFSDIVQTLEQKAAEDSRFTWFVMNNIVGYLVRGLNVPTHILDGLPGGAAFVATLQSLINQAIADGDGQSSGFYDMDLGYQVASYSSDLRAGYRVIVVAHSQGNMYANAARTQLTSLGASLAGSYAVNSVATPAETAPDGYVTSDSDLVIGLLRTLGKTVLPANIHVTPSSDDFLGHGFEEIYINDALPARAAVVANIANIANRLPFPTVTCPDDGQGSLSLAGAEVEYKAHCCDAPLTDANLLGTIRFSIVGPGVELPDLSGVRGSIHTIAADIDVLDSAIEITYNESATSLSGTFNGYELDFSGVNLPTIVGATFGSSSTVNLTNATVSVEGNTVLVNLPSTTVTVGSTISVILTLL